MSEVNIKYQGYKGCPAIELPLSKSMAARSMMLAAYMGRELPTDISLDCDDLTALHTALTACLDSHSGEKELHIGSSGTAMRFILSFASLRRDDTRRIVLRGSEQVQSRPVGSLVESLRSLGAGIEYLEKEGYLPVAITPRALDGAGVTEVDTSESSQYMSSLMLLATALPDGMRLRMKGHGVSYSYIMMTSEMLGRAGFDVLFIDGIIEVKRSGQELRLPVTEADWSAAGYFYEALALAPVGSQVFLKRLLPFGESLQGDSRLQKIFEGLGIATEVEQDGLLLTKERQRLPKIATFTLKSIPDTVPALAATLCGLNVPYNLDGLSHLRLKESDRLDVLAGQLYSMGYGVHDSAGGIVYNGWPRRNKRRLDIYSYGDHRIAMAMAPLAVYSPIDLHEAEAVEKSFPGYFDELQKVGYKITFK